MRAFSFIDGTIKTCKTHFIKLPKEIRLITFKFIEEHLHFEEGIDGEVLDQSGSLHILPEEVHVHNEAKKHKNHYFSEETWLNHLKIIFIKIVDRHVIGDVGKVLYHESKSH